jgi:hypothetical protein
MIEDIRYAVVLQPPLFDLVARGHWPIDDLRFMIDD